MHLSSKAGNISLMNRKEPFYFLKNNCTEDDYEL
jgi:hypothetical protein